MANIATKQIKVDDRDWSKLSFGQQLKMLEIEGYLVLPNVLSEDKVELLKKETSKIDTSKELCLIKLIS